MTPLSRRNFLSLTAKSFVLIGAGNMLQSFAANSFRLPDEKEIALRFIVTSDGHYGEPNTDYVKYHTEMKDWINAEKHDRGVDFAFINGDLFHNDIAFLPEVKKLWSQLEMPFYVSHGNHDKTDEDTWQSHWNLPLNYTFEKADAGFIVLNTADEKGEYVWADIDWSNKQLQQFATKKQVFVFMHITPFKWTNGGNPYPALVEAFNKQTNLKAVFHGHDHDQDEMKENAGKFYFFDAHLGGSWGTKYHGYRVVEVLKNNTVLTYQMNPAEKQTVNTHSL